MSDPDDLVGVDAALDFPLAGTWPQVIKGFQPPSALAGLFQHRKDVESGATGQGVLMSTHGEAGRFFATFVDNHAPELAPFRFVDPANPARFDDQALDGGRLPLLAAGYPRALLRHRGGAPRGRREHQKRPRGRCSANPNAFDTNNPFFIEIEKIAAVGAEELALRYGRQYFGPISGNGADFGISNGAPGIVSFSRILNDTEVVVIANTFTGSSFSGFALVDFALNPDGFQFARLDSKEAGTASNPGPCGTHAQGTVTVHNLDGSTSNGPVGALAIHVAADGGPDLRAAAITRTQRSGAPIRPATSIRA